MEYEDSNTVSPNYLAMLLRHKWFLVISIPPLIFISSVIVVLLPPVYQSIGVVLVETQQIPQDFVRATINSVVSERIEIIKQRVMTRQRLSAIADKYGLFADKKDSYPVSRIMQEMRDSTVVDLVNTGGNRSLVTIAFKVGFEARNPSVAQAVANDLITLFLSENIRSRTESASETTEFLESEADKLKTQLDATETLIVEFKQGNKDSLPEHLTLYMDILGRSEKQFQDLEREQRSLEEQQELLEVQLASIQDSSLEETPGQKKLSALKEQYASLNLNYQSNYPTLLELERQIEGLEASSASAIVPVSMFEIEVETKLVASRSQLEALLKQKEKSLQKMEDLEAQIIRVPEIERGLLALNRDHENTRTRYESTVSKRMEAEMAESLEQSRKAERFSIIEPPILPDKPIKPKRAQLLMAGLGASIFGPFGLVLLLGMTDQSVRGSKELRAIIGEAPLVMVPYISNSSEDRIQRRIFIYLAVALVLCGLGALAGVHFLYQPLDLLVYRVLGRFEFL